MIKSALNKAKFLVPPIVAFFIGRVIYRNWQQVQQASWTFDPLFLLLSLTLTALWFVLRPWVWKLILERLGHPIPFHGAFRVVRQGELSRYIPGTIWQYLSRVYLASQWGVPAASTLAASLVETVLLLLAALLPATWSLSVALPTLHRHHQILLVVVPLVAFAVIHPKIMNAWAGFVSRRLKQPYAELKIRWITMAAIWGLYLVTWLVHSFSVAVFVRGVMVVPLESLPQLASDYVLAWLVGMILMVSPAGMGIRDGMFGLLLSRRMPLGAGFTVAVAVRLWLTLVELFWTLGGQWLIQYRGLPSPGDEATDPLR